MAAVFAAGAAGFATAFGAGCAVCARAESLIPHAVTPIIKAKKSARHMLEWFPQYCDWKMARPRFVPEQG
ncbi:hypothetical protein [Bradyrhizobium sp. 1]|uniref:hypothetical protein n=1 Tax=Bradyrhizobium sp. 1 TaxID=241591 RepID=UPI001FF9975D